ncbi:MAG: phosphodiesterase [Halorhodospira sp.]
MITILQLTDLHLSADPAAVHHGVMPWARLAEVLEQARRGPTPDLVMVTGDISHDAGHEVYRPCRHILGRLRAPVQVLPGNHDVPRAFAASFPAGAGVGFAAERWLGSWRLLSLNSQIPGAVPGRLGERQLRWLEGALATDPQVPTVLALHHAPVSVGTPWLDAHRLVDHAALLELLSRYPAVRAVLFGHVHQAVDQATASGIRMIATPAVSVQFRPGSRRFSVTGAPPALRWLRLSATGELDTELWQPEPPADAPARWHEGLLDFLCRCVGA